MSKEYSNESIKRLSEIDKVRKKPSVMFGTSGLSGVYHMILEIVANSVDEAKAGFGNTIWVTCHPDNSWTVKDEGRGLPMAYNKKEKIENYKLNLEVLFAGGKMDDNENGAYEFSLGTNGCGLCATNYASEWCKVESKRDGSIYTVGYEKGIETQKFKEVKDKDKKQKTGTTVSWLPDLEVFKERVIPKEMVVKFLKLQAMINKGVTFHFSDERDNTKEDFCFKDGILGYAKELAGDKKLAEPIVIECDGKGRDRVQDKDYRVKAEIIMLFNDKDNTQEFYHNSSYLKNGGSPNKAKERAMTEFFKTELKKKGLLKKDLTINDIDENLIYINNSFSSKADYEGQTKFAVDNKFLEDFLTDNILKGLKKWANDNKLEFDKVCKQISINAESRTKAVETKTLTKQKLSDKMGISNRVKNFIDCRSKDVSERELFICEGLSAMGSLKAGRNPLFQAVMPIRGKSLNVLKADNSTILKNELVMDLMTVTGTGMEIGGSKGSHGNFDINNRRFDKIIFGADADVDGLHIICLLLTTYWKLTPELIKQGHIYILNTPLYEIKILDGSNKGEKVYAYSDEEMEKICKGKKVSVSRNKGLGEVDEETMADFLNPQKRKLTKVTLEDVEKAKRMMDLLMDESNDERKEFITKNAQKYLDQIEEVD